MDRVTTLRLFTRIVERRSFSAAAADLQVTRSSATTAIKELEQRVGAKLLQRSTRHVSPTLDGNAYYRRCVAILADLDDADRAFTEGAITGVLRVDTNGHLARRFILPELPAFLDRHPKLTVHLGEGDRLVDLLREGVDCVVRAGEPPDSGLIVRRLGVAHEITCASPAYLREHGEPTSPDDLDAHFMVGFVSSRTGEVMPLEFRRSGEVYDRTLPARVLVNNADTSVEAARLGFGPAQAPRHRFLDDLALGSLVEVLSKFPPTPTTISILYPAARQLSPRVRIFVDWLVEAIGPKLQPM